MTETIEITQKHDTPKESSKAAKQSLEGTSISGSVAVLEAFIAEDVDIIFGYPGGAIMPIYDALFDYQEKLKHILVRHEQGGIHAEAVPRARNGPLRGRPR